MIKIIEKVNHSGIYNIASNKSYKVLDVVKMIAKYLNKNFKNNIKFINDRPFNDKIYKINCDKIKKLNWKQKRNLTEDLPLICDWYVKNKNLFKK